LRLVWTTRAERDLAAVREYIALDKPDAAQRQVIQIVTSVSRLLRFPETGRPGRRANTRELIIAHTPFILAYRLRSDLVEILAVLHGKQRWPDVL